jgi:hypothetical protein
MAIILNILRLANTVGKIVSQFYHGDLICLSRLLPWAGYLPLTRLPNAREPSRSNI